MAVEYPLNEECARFQSRFLELDHSPPEYLFHYTTGQGLLGIFEYRSIWATEIRYMNDASEFVYGRDVVLNTTRAHREGASGRHKQLLERVEKRVLPKAGTTHFVTCFCESHDLLSQWRAYASSTGYAIGFRSVSMKDPRFPLLLRRVVYEEERQLTMIAAIVAWAGEMLARFPDEPALEQLAVFTSEMLHECMVWFKHPTFREENEWRLVLPARYADLGDALKFRAGKTFVVPYVPLQLRHSASEPRLPIAVVVLGPVPGDYDDAAVQGIDRLLKRYGYDDAAIGSSKIPLRVG